MRLPLILLAIMSAAAAAPAVEVALPWANVTGPGSSSYHEKAEGSRNSTEHEPVAAFSNSTGPLGKWNNPGPPACSDAEWETYKCKGANLMAMMGADNKDAGSMLNPPQGSAQSKFNTFPRDLIVWKYATKTETYCDMDNNHFGIAEALRGMNIDPQTGWKCYTTYHGDPTTTVPIEQQTYEVDGKQYRVTRAKYATAINVDHGVLILAARYSPQNEGPKLNPPVTSGFPELGRSSDVIFGQWSIATRNSIRIRYIICWSITNRVTPSIIRKAFDFEGVMGLTKYPGVTFSMGSDAGKALLGSPNGIAVGYFLAQHKDQLGFKEVTHVTVFAHTSSLMPSEPVLVFQVQDNPK